MQDETLHVRVTGGFVVSFALMMLICGTDGFVAALSGTLLHELSHGVAVRLCGGSVATFTMSFGGFSMDGRFPHGITYPRELICLLSGALSNLLAGTMLRFFGGNDPLILLLAGANLSLGIFNLIPAGALDGGKIVKLILEAWLGPQRGDHAAVFVSAVCAMGVLGIGIVLLMQKADWRALAACVYLSFFLGCDIINANRRRWHAAEKSCDF